MIKIEKVKGYKYTIEGFSDNDKFAKGILALANLKSSDKSVIDFKTHVGSNIVTVIATEETMNHTFENFVGEVTSKEEFDIYIIEYSDLSNINQELLTRLTDRYYESKDVGFNCYFTSDI